MSIFEIIILAFFLATDAFAVSTTKGFALKKWKWKNGIIIGLYFGIFQALMPLIGYLAGVTFKEYIENIDHFIAFGLLLVIGGKMIFDSIKNRHKEDCGDSSLAFKKMILLAIATSIDALTVGIAVLPLNEAIIPLSIILIGLITFLLSLFGVFIGTIIGNKLNSKAEFIGGLVLILIGLKILLSHLEVIPF